MKFQGKAALVTGGARGIGAAIVRHLASEGADVAFTYATSDRSAEALIDALTVHGGRLLGLKADSRDPTAIRHAVDQTAPGHGERLSADPTAIRHAVDQTAETFGRLDILVNNAGVFPAGPIEDVSLQEIDDTLAIHARAVFITSQAALSHMRAGGRIISIGSCFAQRVPYGGVTLYAMSKSALIGFTKGLAREVGERGVTVNIVDPGSTETDMNPIDGPTVAAELELMAVKRYS